MMSDKIISDQVWDDYSDAIFNGRFMSMYDARLCWAMGLCGDYAVADTLAEEEEIISLPSLKIDFPDSVTKEAHEEIVNDEYSAFDMAYSISIACRSTGIIGPRIDLVCNAVEKEVENCGFDPDEVDIEFLAKLYLKGLNWEVEG